MPDAQSKDNSVRYARARVRQATNMPSRRRLRFAVCDCAFGAARCGRNLRSKSRDRYRPSRYRDGRPRCGQMFGELRSTTEGPMPIAASPKRLINAFGKSLHVRLGLGTEHLLDETPRNHEQHERSECPDECSASDIHVTREVGDQLINDAPRRCADPHRDCP